MDATKPLIRREIGIAAMLFIVTVVLAIIATWSLMNDIRMTGEIQASSIILGALAFTVLVVSLGYISTVLPPLVS